jgi:hypothetical protein
VVPGRLAKSIRCLSQPAMRKQSHYGEQSQERRGGPPDRQIRPLPLGLEPKMPAYLLEGHFQLPAHNEPTDDPLRIGFEVGTQKSLGLKPALRIAHQNPQRTGTADKPVEYHTAVSEAISTLRSLSAYQLAIVVSFQTVFGSSATAERFGSRSPLRRGLPLCPG